MNLSYRPLHSSLALLSAAALLVSLTGHRPVAAQGLSGPPQRLEETLQQRGTSPGGTSPRGQSPGGQSPGGQSPGGQSPGGQSPGGQSPGGQSPGGQSPGGQSPGGPGSPDMEMEMDSDMDMDDMEMEMEMDMEMGMGNFGGGRSRSRASGTPQADAMQIYASSLIAARDGLDFSPLFAPVQSITVDSGPVLGREAETAFKSGNHGLALELMFGHMATEFKDALVAIKTVKYSPAVRRPVWSIRWGVSMAVRGDGVDPQPIREGATPSRQGFPMASRGGPGRRGTGGGGPGEFGEMEMEMDMEEQGMEEEMDMDMDMEMEMGMGMPRSGGRGASGRGGALTPAQPSIPVREMLSKEANEALDKTLGLVATVTAEEFAERFQKGDFGPVFATVSAPPPAAEPARGFGRQAAAVPIQPSMSAELNDALSEAAEPLPMWRPGLVFLGLVDSYADVIPAARSQGIDLVLHFDVALKPGRNEAVQNISRCRLINVATGKSVATSKGMDNREAAQLAAAGRMGERAYVEQQLGNLFAIIDRDVKVVDLPALTADVARRRIASLISGPKSRTLRTLAEIRLYQAQGLIKESEVETAFDIVGGMEALTLLHGARDQRIATARKWAVESQGQ